VPFPRRTGPSEPSSRAQPPPSASLPRPFLLLVFDRRFRLPHSISSTSRSHIISRRSRRFPTRSALHPRRRAQVRESSTTNPAPIPLFHRFSPHFRERRAQRDEPRVHRVGESVGRVLDQESKVPTLAGSFRWCVDSSPFPLTCFVLRANQVSTPTGEVYFGPTSIHSSTCPFPPLPSRRGHRRHLLPPRPSQSRITLRRLFRDPRTSVTIPLWWAAQ